jgi:type II secretory pathway component PulF
MEMTQPMMFAVQDNAGSKRLNHKVKSDELISFATQLSVMLDSGVVLSDALEAISGQCNPGNFKLVLEDIAHRITGGTVFRVRWQDTLRFSGPCSSVWCMRLRHPGRCQRCLRFSAGT